MNAVLLGVLAYVAFQLAVGIAVSRRVRTESDYLLAGRRLGFGMTSFTLFATWFGAETCIGAAGAIHENGLRGGTADPFGYALCLALMAGLFAVPLWRRRLTTLADLFRERYSPGVERLAVLLMVPTSLLWAAAQIRAFGQVLSASSELAVTATITIAAGIVILYTAAGGLLADAVTDLVQGLALAAGLVLILVAVVADHGGLAATAALVPAGRLRLFADPAAGDGPAGGPASLLSIADAWAIPILGSVVAQELVARVSASRSAVTARRAGLAACAMYLAIGSIPVFLGLAGPALVGHLEEPEQLLPLLAREHLSTGLYIVFAGALVSAILSTVDSALLAAGSLVAHNLILPMRPGMTEAGRVRAARGMVVVFGLVAWFLALQAEGIYHLVEAASAFGSAGLVVILVFGLFTRFGGPSSAVAALLTGVVVWATASRIESVPAPYLTSLAAAAAAYVIVRVLRRRT